MDTLTKWFDEYSKTIQGPTVTTFQVYQAGVTKGAVSMRRRVLDILLESKSVSNEVINKVGQLSDIPDKE